MPTTNRGQHRGAVLPEPIVLFGETYHHPNILWRTGFLAPDPVVYIEINTTAKK